MEAKGIRIERLNSDNFGPCSLDRFVRTQPVTEVWRRSSEGYRLVRQPFVDDWSPERKREKACELLSPGCTVYGAFIEGRVVGFVQLNDALNGGRMIVESLHVSREFRHRGLGRALFERALGEARARRASCLYISACSSRETIAFYRAMGCVPADPVIPELAEEEPFDLQLTRPAEPAPGCCRRF